jgi:hypothetical protein
MRRGFVALALAAGLLVAGCSKDSPATVQLYARVPVPAVPDRTSPPDGIGKAGASGDGQYWATNVTFTKNNGLEFSLAQAFFGATCTTELGADRCANGVGVDDSKKGGVSIVPSGLTVVTVVAANGQNYAIDGTELARLITGGAPSPSAPTDYKYIAGPFLVTISGGGFTAANEILTPG